MTGEIIMGKSCIIDCSIIIWFIFSYSFPAPCVTTSIGKFVGCTDPFHPLLLQHPRLRMWGILTRRVGAVDSIQTPEDVIQTMVQELNRPALRGWVGLNTEVRGMKLDCCRKWKSHFSDPQQVKLSGGLLEDSTANHTFIFMLRRGWSWLKNDS